MNIQKIGIFALKAIAAIIMLQTLTFKFSGAAESVYVFTTMGIEPWGRYGSGIVEGLASILLFIPRTTWLGAMLGCGVMAGALISHLTKLGIVVMGDGGQLFGLAIVTFTCCGILLLLNRKQIPIIGKFL